MDLVSLLPSPARRDLTLALRAVTPVYLHGANANERARQDASVRGALHRWLWMLLGGLRLGTSRLTPRDVALVEARIFGTTTWSPGLSVRITGITPPSGAAPFVDHHRFAYVSWSLQDKGDWPARSLIRVAVDAGPQAAGQSLPAENLALAAACWCWATLGWLGGRGRRGFGAFRCESATGALAEAFADLCGGSVASVWVPPVTPDAWKTFLVTGIAGALQAAKRLIPDATAPAVHVGNVLAPAPADDPPDWPGFAAGHWAIRLIDYGDPHNGQPTWANALAEISQELRIIREDPDNDFMLNGQELYKTHDLRPLNRALAAPAVPAPIIDMPDNQFGLPRPYRINGTTYGIGPRGSKMDRVPSPVIARPVALDQDGAHVAVLWLALRSTFLPAGVPVEVRSGGNTLATVKPPPKELPQVVTFMQALTNAGKSLADLAG